MSTAIEETIDLVEKKPTFFQKHFPYLASLPFPGKFDELGSTGKEILGDDSFEGFKTEISFNHSERYNSSHSYHLFTPRGESNQPSYLYNIIYTSDNTFCFARLDNEKKLFCKFGHFLFNKKIGLQFLTNMTKDSLTSSSFEIDYKLPFACLGFRVDKSLAFSTSIFSSLSKKVSAGYEFTKVPDQGVEIHQLGLKYQRGPVSYVGHLNSQLQCNLSCIYKKHNLEAVSDLMIGLVAPQQFGSQFSAGFRYFFKNSILRFKGDSTGHFIGQYEEGITSFMKICYSASLNYMVNEYKFGLGLSIVK